MHLEYVQCFFFLHPRNKSYIEIPKSRLVWQFIWLYCFLFPPLKQVETALSPGDFRQNFTVSILRYDDITCSQVS